MNTDKDGNSSSNVASIILHLGMATINDENTIKIPNFCARQILSRVIIPDGPKDIDVILYEFFEKVNLVKIHI
jgi:hypothetical protein